MVGLSHCRANLNWEYPEFCLLGFFISFYCAISSLWSHQTASVLSMSTSSFFLREPRLPLLVNRTMKGGRHVFSPQSFPAGAEFTGMIPRKICSHMPSAKSQKGDLSLIMSFFLKPFGGLPVVLRAKTKSLLKTFQALQIWPLLIPPFFLAPHPSHPDLPALSGALSPLPRTGPPLPVLHRVTPSGPNGNVIFFKGRVTEPPDWIRFFTDILLLLTYGL